MLAASIHVGSTVLAKPIPFRASGHLSCSLAAKGVSSQPRRRHDDLCRAACSTRQGTSTPATATDSSDPQHIEIIEGSHLQRRPDSTNGVFLYTHMLCPYAQTALLTLLCKVRQPDQSSDPPRSLDMLRSPTAGCAAPGGARRLISKASMVHAALPQRRLCCHCPSH